MDSAGILSDDRERVDDYKKELAWPAKLANELEIAAADRGELEKVIAAYKPTDLIGASGQGGSFTESSVCTMADNVETPVILPMSNPTSISEAMPEDLLRWTNGRALVATGSPFDDVKMRGGAQRISQANNVFVFPGLGLGTIVSGAGEVTDSMISAAANALASSLSDSDLEGRCLMPEVSRLWEVCGDVAIAVASQAVSDGVAAQCSNADLLQAMADYRWRPEYPRMVEGDTGE
jgi:malate dehydrogenase (oxaloacetate-decarboxylating)